MRAVDRTVTMLRFWYAWFAAFILRLRLEPEPEPRWTPSPGWHGEGGPTIWHRALTLEELQSDREQRLRETSGRRSWLHNTSDGRRGYRLHDPRGRAE